MILRWIHIFLFLNAFALIRSQHDSGGGGIGAGGGLSEEESSASHFNDVGKGRMSWIVEDQATPWIGSYHFLGSAISHSTTLLSVVDSSTGKKLAECSTTPSDPTTSPSSAEATPEWHKFVWTLNKDSLECNISTSDPYIVNIEPSPHPRSYSVRILAVKGPRCFRDIIIQNEEPKGCPPVLRRNTFSAHNFDCGCPKSIIEKWTAVTSTDSSAPIAAAAVAALTGSNENGSQIPLDANGVPFPLFQLGENETEITRVYPVGVERVVAAGVTQATPVKPPAGFTFKANACFGFDCFNNGTCVLDTQAQPSCLCNDGYAGEHCEIDLCAQTACQNGGFCQIQNKVPICQCPAGTLGANCETVVCPNDCQNDGICMFVNNIPMCHCKDGFIGPNCNVKDNCKDASTCSVFGEGAKCITDPSNFGTISESLVDANYSCQCLDDNNEMADCLALALARQSITTRRSFTTTVPSITTPMVEQFETTEVVPEGSQSSPSAPIFVPPLAPIDNGTFVAPTGQPNGPPGEAEEEETMTSKEAENEQNQRQQPGFPVAGGATTASPQEETTIEHEEATEQPIIVTSPAPVPVEVTTEASAVSEETEEEAVTTFAPAITPDLFTILSSTRPPATVPPTTTVEEEEEQTTEEPVATVPPLPPKTEIPPGAGDEDELEGDNGFEMVTQIAEESTTPHGSLWTIPESVEIDNGHAPNSNTVEEHRPDNTDNVNPSISQPSPPTNPNENSIGEGSSVDEKEPDENRTSNVGDSDATSKASSNGASWVSWVIAILAIIVLIALIAAGSLFIVRYVRRSRRLHGKYNPAREENAVASTYAMPMTTVSKQERLI